MPFVFMGGELKVELSTGTAAQSRRKTRIVMVGSLIFFVST
jgi:hypothetical protein